MAQIPGSSWTDRKIVAQLTRVRPNCRVERTLSKGGTCSARAANKFASASLGWRLRGAAQRGR